MVLHNDNDDGNNNNDDDNNIGEHKGYTVMIIKILKLITIWEYDKKKYDNDKNSYGR